MPTTEQCMICTAKCPQAELAHQIALGRMYATNELLALVRKIDGGQLVEVVRCKDCKLCRGFGGVTIEPDEVGICKVDGMCVKPNDFCSYGERREAEHEPDEH